MIDILNSNKEYKITIRFVQGGVSNADLLNSLIGCIESGDMLDIDVSDPSLLKALAVDQGKSATDSDISGLVMSMTRAEQAAVDVNSDQDTTIDAEGEGSE